MKSITSTLLIIMICNMSLLGCQRSSNTGTEREPDKFPTDGTMYDFAHPKETLLLELWSSMLSIQELLRNCRKLHAPAQERFAIEIKFTIDNSGKNVYSKVIDSPVQNVEFKACVEDSFQKVSTLPRKNGEGLPQVFTRKVYFQ